MSDSTLRPEERSASFSGKAAELARKATSLLDREVIATSKSQASPAQYPGSAVHFDLPPLPKLRAEVEPVADALSSVLVGRAREVRLALTAWLSGGHVLIDGAPGLGKTTLARALSAVLGRDMRRVQFTSDFMPSDLLGASIYDAGKGAFVLHRGPVFSQILLADEINRAPPRAQSALLEAMAEHRVSIDGETLDLPQGFFVIATQNPLGQVGTFPLPESQLDRFLLRIEFGTMDRTIEREILRHGDRRADIDTLAQVAASLPRDGIAISEIHMSDRVLDYIQDLMDASHVATGTGLSVRAGLGLMQAARCWAWLHDREAVEPEDVQAVFGAVAAHRLAGADAAADPHQVARILRAVAIP